MVRDSARKLLKEQAGVERLRTLVARDHREAYESEVQPARFARLRKSVHCANCVTVYCLPPVVLSGRSLRV